MSNTSQGSVTGATLRKRVLSLPTLLATVIGASLFAVVLWRVFDFDWSQLWSNIRGINLWQYAVGLVLYYVSFWFRGMRWRLIAITANIDRRDGANIPGTTTMGVIILMGWFANSVAFLRLGDALRGWTLARESRSPFASSLGTVLAERVQDMVAVLILVLVAAIWVTVTERAEVPIGVLIAAIALVAVLIIALVVMKLYGTRFASWLPGRVRPAYERFQRGTLDSFQGAQLPPQFALGVLGWLLEIARFYFVAEALGLDIGFGIVMFAALANAMLTTIPTPGGFGFVEGGLTGLLIILGVDDTSALSLTVVDRSISWVSVVLFGGVTFFVWHSIRRPGQSVGHGATAPVEQGDSTPNQT
jgi:uncharacterized protein (TIRG00374 family)